MKEREWRDILAGLGRDFRPPQYRGACAIDAIYDDRGGCLLMEAPTGVGKTLMYLGPLKLHGPGCRVLVSTMGKLLQEQVCESADELELGETVVLKGRANYICVEACKHYLEAWRTAPRDFPLLGELEKLIDIVGKRDVPDTADILAKYAWTDEFRDFLRHHLTSSSAYCRNGHPGRAGRCFYLRLLDRAKTCRVLITNHHALLSLAAAPGESREVLAERTLVVDEAHAFGEAASSVFTLTVASAALRDLERNLKRCAERLAGELRAPVAARAAAIGKFCKAIDAAVSSPVEVVLRSEKNAQNSTPPATRWKKSAADGPEKDPKYEAVRAFASAAAPEVDIGEAPKSLRTELNDLVVEFNDLRNALRKMVGLEVYQTLPQPENEFQRRCQDLADTYRDDERSVLYLECPDGGDWAVKCSPIECSEMLEPFWEPFRGCAALSATLTTGADEGGFDFFADSCGLPGEHEELILPTVFGEEQCMVFVPNEKSDFSRLFSVDPARFLYCRTKLIALLARAFCGRTLALFTALQRLRATSAVLSPLFEKYPACEVLTQDGSVSNDELAEKFVKNTETLLLGSRSFFQGFDAPGETLSCLILEKLPFDRVDDPVLSARIRKAGKDAFRTVQLPSMLLALRQAFGRLLRKESDRGIFVLADPRFMISDCRYGKEVLYALGGRTPHRFSDPTEILKELGETEDFLGFPLDDPEDICADFEKGWQSFTASALFRKLTGLRSLDDLLKKLKIEALRPWQKTIVDNVLDGISGQLAIYPAGSGKSLTYQIPALMRPGLTLVISPLVSLMNDQVDALHAKGIYEAECLNSRMTRDPERVMEKLKQGKLRLLYVAPEKLHHTFISTLLSLPQEVTLFVIDEAHMISEAGAQWRPLYGELAEARRLLEAPQVLAVTATAGANIQADIQKHFDIDDRYVFRNTVVRKFVNIAVNRIGRINDHYVRARAFVDRANGRPVLIYCMTPDFVESLARSAEFNGITSVQYYTGKSHYREYFASGRYIEREKTLSPDDLAKNHRKFITGKVNVMIATNAYGMGIDKPDIWGVLYNNVPASLEELVQGIGRICRDEKLLMEYAERGDPATAEISYESQDLNAAWRKTDPVTGEVSWVGKGQLAWKILDPFEKLKSSGLELLRKIIAAGLAPHEENLAVPGGNQLLGQSKEEDRQKKVCILIARFLREQGVLERASFDWGSSKYVFMMKEPCTTRQTAGFAAWCDKQCQRRRKQLDEVEKFCCDPGCRNRYLENYFSGRSPDVECAYCDNCGKTDNELHRKFVEAVDVDFVPLFRRGVFLGNAAAFAAYLRESLGSSAAVGYLQREYRESGASYCDAAFAAALLEALNEHDPVRSGEDAIAWEALYRDFLAADLSAESRQMLGGILKDMTALPDADHATLLELCAPDLADEIESASGAAKLAKYEKVADLLDAFTMPALKRLLSLTGPGGRAAELSGISFFSVRKEHPRIDSPAAAVAWGELYIRVCGLKDPKPVESLLRACTPLSPGDHAALLELLQRDLLQFKKRFLNGGLVKDVRAISMALTAIRRSLRMLGDRFMRDAVTARINAFCGQIYGPVCAKDAMFALWLAAVTDHSNLDDEEELERIAGGAAGLSADDLAVLKEAVERHEHPGLRVLLMGEEDAVGKRVISAVDLKNLLPLAGTFVPGWSGLVDACLALGDFPDFSSSGKLPANIRGMYKKLPDEFDFVRYFLRKMSERLRRPKLAPGRKTVHSTADIDKLFDK